MKNEIACRSTNPWAVGCIGLVLLFGLGCQRKAKEDPFLMKVSYGMYIDDLPFYVALEEGLWRAEGLKVELVRLPGQTNTLAAALRGDIACGSINLPTAVHGAAKNLPFKVVSWFGRAHPKTRCGIHVDKLSSIDGVADLRGKKIAMGGSIVTKMILKRALEKGGVDETEVTRLEGIQIDEAMKHEAALRSKGVDAIIT